MTWGITGFRSGDGVGFVSRLTLGLLAPGSEAALDVLWRRIADDAPLDDILDELSGHGIRALPSFGLARFEDDGLRVVVRGAVTVRTVIQGADEGLVVDGTSVRTWREEFVHTPSLVELALPDAAGVTGDRSDVVMLPFEVLAGVVPAAFLRRHVGSEDARSAVATTEWRRPTAAPPAPPDAPATADAAADGPEPPSDPVDGNASDPESMAPPAVELTGDETFTTDDLTDLEVHEPAISRAGSVEGTDGGVDDYDYVFGHTVMRSVEDAAVRVDVGDADPGTAHPPEVGRDRVDGVPVVAPEVPPFSGATLIDGVPTGASGPAPALGDHDGHTISKAQLLAMSAPSPHAAATVAAPAGTPLVPSIPCTAGHPNPPHATTCRICGAPSSGAAQTMVPRPPLAVLALSTGDRIVVDRPLVIGRNPKIGGGMTGELPRLVKLDTAGPGLSRTHAEIHIEGWQILLQDTNSSNGTEVTLPGHATRRIHAAEAVGLLPGTVVDLGGEVTFTVEAVR